MRNILIGILLLALCGSAQATISSSNAEQVFNRLWSKTGSSKSKPEIVFTNDSGIRAETNGHRIYISKGMLKFIKNSNEAAMVIGHEIGHKILGHVYIVSNSEVAADIYGASLSAKAGYSVCSGLGLMKRMQTTFGDGGGDKEHPNWSTRIAALGGYGCA